MRPGTLVRFVSFSILTAFPAFAAPPAKVVKTATPTPGTGVQVVPAGIKPSGAERILASTLTLQQALAKPDATQLVHPDGKESTVGDLRRRVKAREMLLTTKPPALGTGGPVKTASLSMDLEARNGSPSRDAVFFALRKPMKLMPAVVVPMPLTISPSAHRSVPGPRAKVFSVSGA